MLKWSYHTFREMTISEERKGHLQEISLNLQVMAMSKLYLCADKNPLHP